MTLEVGFSVTHRRYVPYAHAHYGGNLVDGAYGLAMFGDVVEVTATVTRVGTRSRDLAFEAKVLCRAAPERGPSSADVLDPPVVATKANATIVVPPTAPMVRSASSAK